MLLLGERSGGVGWRQGDKMGNSILAIFDGATGIIRIVIIVFVCLAVIGALVTLPGLPQEAKAIAEQTSNSISWLVIFLYWITFCWYYFGFNSICFLD